ncbi:MAG: acyltransferase family protein [Bacteroidales bacterium]
MKFYSLQILRGLSAMIVVVFHVFEYADVRPFGYMFAAQPAVDVFFLLSGFIILYTLNQKDGGLQFFIRRFFRIYPLYFIILVIHLFIIYPFDNSQQYWNKLAFNLFFIPFGENLYNSFIVGVAWSTSFEWYFYILITIFLMFKLQKRRLSIFLIFILFTVYFVNRYLMPYIVSNPEPNKSISMIPGSYHIFMFLLGVVIFLFYDRIKKFGSRNLILLSFLISNILFMTLALMPYHPLFALFVVPLVFISWLKVEINGLFQFERFVSRALIYLGEISFSIFLSHMIFVKIFMPIAKESVYLYALLVLILTILFSSISFKYIETYFIRIGKVLNEKLS